MQLTRREFCQSSTAAALGGLALPAVCDTAAVSGPVLDAERQFKRFKFWSNRDWDWYAANVPLWESPDQKIDEVYYYRAELLTKHMRYASVETGYIFTEFSNAETLPWAGRYNAIASATDLQFEEIRWLKTKQYGEDYARYWMLTEGARPRDYGFAAAWSACQMGCVHGDQHVAAALLDKYVANYEAWATGLVKYPHDHGFDPERQMFWNQGRDMGGEHNLASCQLSEPLRGIVGYKIRGGAGYRPDMNAVMFGEAQTIGRLAKAAGRSDIAAEYEHRAATLQKNLMQHLWDDERQFFLHRWRYDEYSEGDDPRNGGAGQKSIRQWSKIWETNCDRNGGVGFQPELAGTGRGREITGYIPWRYNMPEDGERYGAAWRFLMSPEYFYAPWGPTTAEQKDPWFHVMWEECRHNGQSWPFHTARILSAGAKLLRGYQHTGGYTRADWFRMFSIYAKTHDKDGKPHLAECHDPFSERWTRDRWPGLDYLHSSYMDHVITGVAGLIPSDDETLVVDPLAPAHWEYFALDRVRYRNHEVSIVWDRTGSRYHVGAGLSVIVDGRVATHSPTLRKLIVTLTPATSQPQAREVVLSANTEGAAFPKAQASFSGGHAAPAIALNGLTWYDPEYGLKWSSRGSWTKEDWFQIDLGVPKRIGAVRLFLYADDTETMTPQSYRILYEENGAWIPVAARSVIPEKPVAGRANTTVIEPVTAAKVRIVFKKKPAFGVGLAQAQLLAPVEG